MSDAIDIKPVFSSIRIKTEPVEYKDDIKPRKINLEDMVRRRKFLKRRTGKKGGRRRKKKRKFKRRKRQPTTAAAAAAHRPNTVESVRKAFIRNLGIDAEIEREDFSAVIPEVPSLPESEEKVTPSPPVIKDISDISIAPPEDLLDVIMEKQEQMFSQSFKSKKRQLTQDEIREKDERRMKRQEAKEEKKRIEEENRRRQREIREREKREQERLERESRALCDIMPSNDSPFSPPPKRKSRFNDDQVPFVNAFNRNPDKIQIIHRAPDQLPPPLPLQITSNPFNPALAFLQQANFEQTLHQNALLQQQLNLEYLAAASLQSSVNPLVAQMLQNVLPQPQHLFLPQQPPPPQHLLGMPPPPPPPDTTLFNFGNNCLNQQQQQQSMINQQPTADTPGSSSMFFSDPPPPPLFDDITPSASSKHTKKSHVNSIASLVKPYADKYGKRYKLSTESYKKMCVKIVKKVAKYNTPPKPDRIERLVQEYAHYLYQKADRQKRKL
jgi:hypothetical protein